jgi:hypothetical protein
VSQRIAVSGAPLTLHTNLWMDFPWEALDGPGSPRDAVGGAAKMPARVSSTLREPSRPSSPTAGADAISFEPIPAMESMPGHRAECNHMPPRWS